MSTVGPDPRFYEWSGPMSLSELLAGARCSLPAGVADADISAITTLDRADARSLSFLTDARRLAGLAASRAGFCLVPGRLDTAQIVGQAALIPVERPAAIWSQLAQRMHPARRLDATAPFVHPTAVLHPGVSLGQGCVIGAGVEIGQASRIGPGAVIGPGCTIGRGCDIGPLASLACAYVGDRVRLYAGARIGESGFGATAGSAGIIDIPQLGRVILQDSVTVGANSCIDRGAYDDTVIGENTKLDNLVHVAHNVVVGRNCVMAAYTGISGSVRIGDGVAFGGRAGVADHLEIGSGAQIGAGAAVLRSVPAGETWGGVPAQPMRSWLREVAWLSRAARPGGKSKS